MKRILLLVLMSLATVPVFADVGVSVQIGQPGFYGRIDLGDMGPPALIYSQPVLIDRYGPERRMPPLYLRVPPGYERHWERYCDRYQACGRPVYFVRDNWYRQVYVPHYQQFHDRYRRHDNRYDDRGDNWRNRGDHGDHGDRGHGYGNPHN